MKLFLLTTFLAAVSAQNCCNDPDDRDDCFDCCTNQNTEDRCLDRFRSGNGNNGNNGNGDCGYDDKCGHCKQEWCPNLNARDACKAELCSAKELAFFFPEDVIKKSETTLRGSFVALANDCDNPPVCLPLNMLFVCTPSRTFFTHLWLYPSYSLTSHRIATIAMTIAKATARMIALRRPMISATIRTSAKTVLTSATPVMTRTTASVIGTTAATTGITIADWMTSAATASRPCAPILTLVMPARPISVAWRNLPCTSPRILSSRIKEVPSRPVFKRVAESQVSIRPRADLYWF